MTKFFFALSFFLASFVFVSSQEEAPEEKEDTKQSQPKVKERQLESELILGTKEEQFKVPGSAVQLDEKFLDKFEYDDVHKVLSQVPGVYIRGEDGFGLRPNIGIRGATSERSSKITLMEDRVLFGPAPYSAPAAYYFPMVTRMTNVEVFKGPSSIEFGPHTVGGAFNMTTRDIPRDHLGRIDVSYGSFQTAKGHIYVGKMFEQLGFVVEGLRLQSEGFKDLDGGGDTGFEKNEWMVKGVWQTKTDAAVYQKIRLKLGYSDEESDETYLGLSDADFRENPNRRYAGSQKDLMEWDRTQINLHHQLLYEDWLEVNTDLYRHDFHRVWRKLNRFRGGPELLDILTNPDSGQRAVYYSILAGSQDSSSRSEQLMVGANDREFYSQGVQSQVTLRHEGNTVSNTVDIGLRLHQDQIKRLHTEDAYNMSFGSLSFAGEPQDITAHNKADATAFSGFIKWDITWDKLIVSPGIRVESIHTKLIDYRTNTGESDSHFEFLPGLGAFYQAHEYVGIFAGVYRGFSPITPGQKDVTDPEESINYELGLRFRKDLLQVEVIGFYNDYSNLLAQASLAGGGSDDTAGDQSNSGEVNIMGLELRVLNEFQFEHFVLPIGVNYTFTDTEFQTSFVSDNPQLGTVKKGDELPYTPQHLFSVTVGFVMKKWGVHLAGQYVSSSREAAGTGTPLSGKETEGYFITDISIFYEPFNRHHFYLKADNIFDEDAIVSRRPYGARPGKPQFFALGYKFTF